MGNYPELDIDAAHEAILDAIKAKFSAFETVADYERQKESIKCPAVILDFESIEKDGRDLGTEQLSVRIRWQLTLLLKFNTANVQRVIRKLIAALCLFIDGNNFALPCNPCALVGAYADTFDDGGYDAWRVDFEMKAVLGETIWTDGDIVPSELGIMTSWAPEIGEAHKDDYEKVEDVSTFV
ncbi:hypothetical protein [Halodesulfovibrio aestuarii]|uniref:Phage protein n=1 Tax=Halodesulfovibrio aestuarii TaxID=126333 RepID=A0ABV4JU24_9BACT